MAKFKLGKKLKKPGIKKPKKLSLEEVREKYDFGTRDRAIAELEEFERTREACREATNAQNRAKTQAGKALKALVGSDEIEVGEEIWIDSNAYSYDFAYSDDVDVAKLYDLMVAGKIKKDDFLRSVSVLKDAAKKFIGEHILMKVTEQDKAGKTLDVRVRKLDVPVTVVRYVKKAPKPSKKLSRRVDEAPTSTRAPTIRRTARRFVRVRR